MELRGNLEKILVFSMRFSVLMRTPASSSPCTWTPITRMVLPLLLLHETNAAVITAPRGIYARGKQTVMLTKKKQDGTSGAKGERTPFSYR